MSEYMIPVSIEKLENGEFLATSSVLQGLVAQGRTVAETIEIAEDVARKLIESCIEHNDPIPQGFALKETGAIKLNLQIPVPVEM